MESATARAIYSQHHLCFKCRSFKPENGPKNCIIYKQVFHLCEEFFVAAPIVSCEQFQSHFIPIEKHDDDTYRE
jgi:hypothetical protein